MPDYRNMTAAEALRHAKEQSGKTAEEIAAALGTSTAVVTRYFRSADSYGPGLDKLPGLCKALGNTVLVDWLTAQTQETDGMPPARNRAEVLTAVARATAALGEVSRLLAETEEGGIHSDHARAIRSGLDDVKMACSVTQGMLDELAASQKSEGAVLASIRCGGDDYRISPEDFFAGFREFDARVQAILSGTGRSSWFSRYYSRLRQKLYTAERRQLPDWFHTVYPSMQISLLKLAGSSGLSLPDRIEIPETAIDPESSGMPQQ